VFHDRDRAGSRGRGGDVLGLSPGTAGRFEIATGDAEYSVLEELVMKRIH
jgi:hypothetical protein